MIDYQLFAVYTVEKWIGICLKGCGGERCTEVRITELNASEPFDEVSLIVFQVMCSARLNLSRL